MEEYQEAQQRHDFLSAQRQDLLDSIRDTEKAIQEIDLVSRQKFAEAFEAINANFREMLPDAVRRRHGRDAAHRRGEHRRERHRHRGSPPGKRLQNVLLLSGGEKALAAVALLMAIFQLPAEPVLHHGRSGCAARRSQHRAPHAPAQRDVACRRSSS